MYPFFEARGRYEDMQTNGFEMRTGSRQTALLANERSCSFSLSLSLGAKRVFTIVPKRSLGTAMTSIPTPPWPRKSIRRPDKVVPAPTESRAPSLLRTDANAQRSDAGWVPAEINCTAGWF